VRRAFGHKRCGTRSGTMRARCRHDGFRKRPPRWRRALFRALGDLGLEGWLSFARRLSCSERGNLPCAVSEARFGAVRVRAACAGWPARSGRSCARPRFRWRQAYRRFANTRLRHLFSEPAQASERKREGRGCPPPFFPLQRFLSAILVLR
jgi:hypothetical protein